MFVSHIFATTKGLPPIPACLYQYVVGANGIFVRAERPGLKALIYVAPTIEPVRGLVDVQPQIRLERAVPRWMTERLLLDAWRQNGKEKLYYLKLSPNDLPAWACHVPEQKQSPGGVHPVDPFAGGADTILEVHSHHGMSAYFSKTDDREERAGFRLFAVLGNLYDRRPVIRTRVGIYGHFAEIPASWVFDLPPYVIDGSTLVAEEMEYVEAIEAA